MIGAFHLTEVRGVPIRIHFTAFFLLPMITRSQPDPFFAIFLFLVILLSVTLHELGHTLVAQRYGIPVREILLTPIGGVAMLETLPENPHHEIRIALAGPYVSFFLALAGALLSFLLLQTGWATGFVLLANFTAVNLMLLLFNLLPSFPMDGGRVLRGWLTQRKGALEATRIAAGIGRWIALAFIVLGLAFGLTSLALVGLFVLFLSGSEYRMMLLKNWQAQTFGQVKVPEEADFIAGPPPYAEPKRGFQPDGLAADFWISLRDLWGELCANCLRR